MNSDIETLKEEVLQQQEKAIKAHDAYIIRLQIMDHAERVIYHTGPVLKTEADKARQDYKYHAMRINKVYDAWQAEERKLEALKNELRLLKGK